MPRHRKYRDNAARQRAYRRRKRQPVYFSRKSFEWSTPPDFFAKLDSEFHFTVDVAATSENAKCVNYFTREQDGLKQEWTGIVWCNPPYDDIGKWLEKAHASAKDGVTVVCLIPARTCTNWWHNFIEPYAEVRFIRGRLKFGGMKTSAPFPSVIAIFRASKPVGARSGAGMT